MTFITIPTTDVDAKSPIDVTLMSTNIKGDLDDLNSRVLGLEGGAGASNTGDTGSIGVIKSGLQTNEAKYWRKKYSFFSNAINSDKIDNPPTGFSLSQDLQDRIIYPGANDTNTSGADNSYFYGITGQLTKNNFWIFKIKKGENFFGLGNDLSPGVSDSVTVKIDGVSVTGKALTDEAGVARSDTFTKPST